MSSKPSPGQLSAASLDIEPQPRVRHIITAEEWLMWSAIAISALIMVIGVLLPLYQILARSFENGDGVWNNFANYQKYFSTPALFRSFFNSLATSLTTTTIAVGLGFIYAYAITRTQVPGKGFFRLMSIFPLYIPPLAHAISLVYLFGNQGLITKGFFGFFEKFLGIDPSFDINLYGFNGIVIGEVLYCFPQAVIILIAALSLTDARLYEASLALKASNLRTFTTVTFPGVKFGLVSAIFVCFTLSFTDFGVPKVVGGDFNVLATDIYKQVIGQQNFVMGATISILLLLPTVIAFIVDRIVQRKQTAALGAKAVPLRPKPNRWLDWSMAAFCGLISFIILAVLATVCFASLIKVWPYNLTPSFHHYDFSSVGGGGYAAYKNSIVVALLTAVFGTIIVFISAYLVEKSRGLKWLRSATYFLSTLPIAMPGLVLGLSYIFFFNKQAFPIPFTGIAIINPFSFLYGTIAILVICNIVHFYTVCFLTATTTLKQLDPEFEAISASMSVPFYKTFWRVTLPLSLPTILEIGMYYFINAMTTVSAVIFLYPPEIPLASVAIVNMDDAGEIAAAAAMSTLIVVTSMVVQLVYWISTIWLRRRSRAWLAK
jgi:iron(III) transport system permease protein